MNNEELNEEQMNQRAIGFELGLKKQKKLFKKRIKDILDGIKLTLQLYSHKHSLELFAEVRSYLDRKELLKDLDAKSRTCEEKEK